MPICFSPAKTASLLFTIQSSVRGTVMSNSAGLLSTTLSVRVLSHKVQEMCVAKTLDIGYTPRDSQHG